MVIKMEGMYVCRMKYPMFLLILKLSESLGYEPVGKRDAVTVGKEKNRKGEVCVCVCVWWGSLGLREKQWHDLKSSKVCTLTMRRVVISSFVQMEHLISPKRWIPFQGQVRFQLNMAESRKHCTFFCKPLSQQAAPASL